ncbi:MAG TPA: OB-fold nucleic acid binding domain-containing protein [Thermoanaerobaculia bacterium]
MRTTIFILVAGALAACSGKQQPIAQSVAQPQTGAVRATALPPAQQQALPPGHPAIPTGAPATVQTQAVPTRSDLVTGKVAETMNAAGYTYVRIATKDGDKWAAVPQTNVKKGDNIAVAAQMVAENFESKTLGRKFKQIIFGAVANKAAIAAPVQAVSNPMMSAMGSPSDHMKPAIDTGAIKVDKAQGGSTVAEVWSGKSALQDKQVVIRGKVVKFLPEIMGKNWLHLRDGSGSREKGNDDITVTTNESVKVGDVVTVTGTLRVDKDFGAGYRYPVIVEDAKISK